MSQELIMIQETERSREKTLIRQCHKCGQLTEAVKEQESCSCCGKSFLPLKYFEKVHDHKGDFKDLFSTGEELEEEDLVQGIYVLW